MIKTLQNANFQFSIHIDKEKTNETRFLSRKLDLIRQNDITKSGFIHSLKHERGHSGFLSRYHGLALGSKY